MSFEVVILTLMSGSVVGLLLGSFGGGGSVLAAPLLVYVVGVDDPHVAIGTSAAAVAAIALISLMRLWRGGRVKWPCATVFAVSGLTGALLGSSLAKLVEGNLLMLGFSVAMAAIALSMLRTPDDAGDPDVRLDPALVLRLAPTGVVVGLAAGFFGIGGGFLIVPGLMLAAGMNMSNATASSLVSVALFGAATSANYAISGFLDLHLLGLLLLGGLAGGMAGLRLSTWLDGHVATARTGFSCMVLLVAGFVAWQAGSALI